MKDFAVMESSFGMEAVSDRATLLHLEIPDSVINELAGAVASRRTGHALKILAEWSDKVVHLRFPQKNTAALTSYFAWAMDIKPSYVSLVEGLIRMFEDHVPKGEMRLLDLVYLDLAQGLVKLLRQERYDEAICHFESAKFGAERAQDQELITVAHYYIGRGHLKNVNYEQALSYMRHAKYLDDLAGRQTRAAVIETIEGLILLLLGRTEEAEDAFKHAEIALGDSVGDHLIEHGNLCLFRARIARRKGNYDGAEKLLWAGVEYYTQQNPSHRNIARAYIHLAVIYRLRAFRLEEEKRCSRIQEQLDHCRCQAINLLEKAEAIYLDDRKRNQQQLGKVHITRAAVFFDQWQFGDAEKEAKAAFDLGEEKRDNLLMAKARIIQCKLALRDPQEPNLQAWRLAEDAARYAQATEYPRLQARVFIWQGRVRLDVLKDVTGATSSLQAASRLLTNNDQDYVREDLNNLKEDIDAYDGENSEVIKITQSDLTPSPNSDFQQIIDEFEDKILRHLHGLMKGNIRKVAKTWRVGERRIRYAVRIFALTDESLRRFAANLTDKILKDLAQKRNLPTDTPEKIAIVGKLVLSDLEELKGKEELGWARFIRLVKQKIGHEEGNMLKPTLLKCFRESDEELEIAPDGELF